MAEDPFPGTGHDGEEPGGSGLLPAGGDGSQDEMPPEGLGQGLYVTLPAEDMTLAGFAQDGRADTMAPGPLLGAVVHAVTGEDGAGLARLSDDQLVGVLSGARRIEARAAWTQLAALAEFARRRPPSGEPADSGEAGFSDFAADELAGELHLTSASAAGQIAYACTVTARLPRTFAALAAGLIHPVHVRIIEDETRILSGDDAARADAKLAEAAQSKTFGQLRYAAHRLVLELDPEAALRRKEKARQDAQVRRFCEDSGNAGMVARELPPDEVLASWQHVEQRALDLRAAGIPGTLQELRVRAYLDLLQETDTRTTLAGPEPGDPASDGDPGPGGQDPGGSGGNPGSGPQDGPPPAGRTGGTGRTGRTGREAGPSIAALVNITIPWTACQDGTGPPGEAAGFGLVDPHTARDLAAAAARHPATRWCITALHPDGTAAAHACLTGRHTTPPGTTNLTTTRGHPGSGPGPPPGTRPQDWLRSMGITLTPIARGHCDHALAETGYRPSRRLEHLVNTRNARCTAPGCGRPAARCDTDHTIAWDKGGITCECDLSPLCRHHHRCKQAEGWRLEQPEPGVLVWHTPARRTYTTGPTQYPV